MAYLLFLELVGLFSGVGVAMCWMPVLRPVLPEPLALTFTFAPTAMPLLGLLFADDRSDEGQTALARIAHRVGLVGAALQGAFVCASMMRVAACGWPSTHRAEHWLIGLGWVAGVYGSVVGARALREPAKAAPLLAAFAPYALSHEVVVTTVGALFTVGSVAVLVVRPDALNHADVVGGAAFVATVGAVGAVSFWERRTLEGRSDVAFLPRLWSKLRAVAAFAAGVVSYAYATRPSKAPALGGILVCVLSLVALWPVVAHLVVRVGLGVRYAPRRCGLVEYRRDYELILPWSEILVERGEVAGNAALFVHIVDVDRAVRSMRFASHVPERRREELRSTRLSGFEKVRRWQGADCTILTTQADGPLAEILTTWRDAR